MLGVIMRKIVVCVLVLGAAGLVATETPIFAPLKTSASLGKQAAGYFLVPTNQMLQPWGEQTMFAGRPVDMAFDSGKRLIAVLNTRSVTLLDGSTGTQVADIAGKATGYAGVAFRPGNREIWASETTRNGPDSLLIAPLEENGLPGKAEHVELKPHPTPTGIAFSPDGKTAYVAFSRNNSLAVMDAETRTVRREVEVGMSPFGVVVAKASGKIFLTNRGGRRAAAGETTAPSSGSQVLTDATTDTSTSGTISVIDAETLAVREVAVGLAPSQLVLSNDEKLLAVANGHSDSVSIVDTATLARTDVKIPTFPEGVVGSQPIASVFAADGKTLYVACGGNNAIAVLKESGKRWKVEGAIPTAWYPSAIGLAADGSLRVLNLKGVGNTARKAGNFNSKQYEGSIERIPSPTPLQIASGTREVRAANMPVYEPAGGPSNLAGLGIQHVFLIVKENRTYDQVLGDLGKGNGDPKLVMYGRDVTPNHHALAEQFVTLDNFFCSGAISFDGHQWLMQAFVSDYTERGFASAPRGYAWDMSDALTVSPAGFFWQGTQKPLDIRIYGEFQLPARQNPRANAVDMNERTGPTWTQYWEAYKNGTWASIVGARSGVPALQQYCSRTYPNNSTGLPDQIRAEEYLRELAEREKSGQMPALNILTLATDHTNGTRPGAPTPRAMVADDDLALGRIVEGISHSRFWAHSLILVVEDDAQDGIDHVDGHRTVALAIGPMVRRNVVDSNNYNHVSMIRTIQEILRVPQRTRYAKAARAMTSIFATQADATPYQKLEPKVALDEMNPPLKALNGLRYWAAQQSAAMDWSEPDDVPSETLNRILWWDAKGWNTAYPSR